MLHEAFFSSACVFDELVTLVAVNGDVFTEHGDGGSGGVVTVRASETQCPPVLHLFVANIGFPYFVHCVSPPYWNRPHTHA